MIAIINFTSSPLTDDQRKQIVASVVEQSDERFICQYPHSRVYEIPPKRTAKATLAAVGLSDAEWKQFAVIPFVPDGLFDGDLLRLVNRQRGYEWPVVRVKDTCQQ